jgi:hypothetical protein
MAYQQIVKWLSNEWKQNQVQNMVAVSFGKRETDTKPLAGALTDNVLHFKTLMLTLQR